MLFLNKKELDYEFYLNFTFNKMLSNKQNIDNKYFMFFKPTLQIFFWFKKIKEDDLDFGKIFNHLILLWLITNNKAKILNIGSVLSRGIKYFRYIFLLKLKKISFFLNFINEILLPIVQKNSRKIHLKNNKLQLYSFSDLSMFTNLRLSSNLYLNSVHNKLFMFIKMNNNININHYLNCLKI